MKILRNYICPIVVIIGTILLISSCVSAFLNYEDGWIVSVYAGVVWLYGYAFHADVISFIKRMIDELVEKN